jgi:hypothetical protein
MTDTQGARFALDESKAREWLGRVFAQAEAIDAGREPEDRDVTLPHITPAYRASDGGCADETASLVRRALADSVITDPEQGDLDSLTWEWIPSDGTKCWAYRWLLHAGPGNVITAGFPLPEDPWGTGLNEHGRELAGMESALAVLREAVQAGNELNERLGDYVASLPLAARAPEISQLVAMLPADDWGADELATLGNWLSSNGFEV